MATIRGQLQELKKITRTRAGYDKQVRDLNVQAERGINQRFAARYDELNRRKDAVEESLRSLNPYQVGDQFQRIAIDGLPGEQIWQVTNVVNDFKFLARPLTTKGQLGKSYDTFRTRKDGYKEPDQIKKVKRRPLK